MAFLTSIAAHAAFENAQIDTGFIERHRSDLAMAAQPVPDAGLALAAISIVLRRDAEAHRQVDDPYSPWHSVSGWRLNADNQHNLKLIDGEAVREVVLHFRRDGYEVEMAGGGRSKATRVSLKDGMISAVIDGVRMRATVVFEGLAVTLLSDGRVWRLTLDDAMSRAAKQEGGSGRLIAPMPGVVVAVLVAAGEEVVRDQPLMVLEAMKMEHTIKATVAGRVAKIHFAVGQQASDGDELLTIENGSA